MKIHDISLIISNDLAVWYGDQGVKIEYEATVGNNSPCNLTRLSLNVHTGTHVDAPLHYLADGNSVETLSLNDLIGEVRVIDFSHLNLIDEGHLESKKDEFSGSRIIFKTSNSKLWETSPHKFVKEYVGLTAGAASWLIDHDIRVVGIDYLSIAHPGHWENVHKILLGNGTIIVEGLNLNGIEPGDYYLICLPIKIKGADGAPARTILLEKKPEIAS